MRSFQLAGTTQAQQSLRFEAEDVTGPKNAWQTNRLSENKWNLWSTDKDAAKKWSGGAVLQSPQVMKERDKPEEGAPPLRTIVRKLRPGQYFVEIGGVGRPLAISLDGKNWRKIEGSSRNLGLLDVGKGGFELWVDDRYASATNPGSSYYDYLVFTPLPNPNRKPKVKGFAETRIEEPLGRGVLAMPMDGGRIYVGWRLLKGDPEDIAFDVYRRANGAPSQKLNQAPLAKTTNFLDENPVAGVRNEYLVVPVAAGKTGKPSEIAAAVPSEQGKNYLSFKLNGDHTFQKCGIADLNGDGVYDYVIKQPGDNIDPYEKYWKPSPETYKIEAYQADGTFLWRYDMGWAIEQGISDTDSEKKSNVRWLFDCRGNILRDDLDWGFGLRTIWWDADLQRELLRGSRVLKYGSDKDLGTVEGSAVGFADVLGDWREEVIVSKAGELRIYSTTIPASDRRVCLMQDPIYRLDVCLQAMGYTQCPMTTQCLSDE
ncbi:MAG: hypothetical protein HUU20_02480 [Pirellulales bacterium]|nr:hypothetical protein [Pirellulales bacterium]